MFYLQSHNTALKDVPIFASYGGLRAIREDRRRIRENYFINLQEKHFCQANNKARIAAGFVIRKLPCYLTSMRAIFFFASSDFGRVIFNTPFLKEASILSLFTSVGSRKAR